MPDINHPITLFGLVIVTILTARFLWNLGDYLSGLIFKGEPSKGTKKSCEDCPAMQAATQRIPAIEEKQRVMREDKLPALSNQLTAINTILNSMDERVKKLFTMIEEIWKEKGP